MGKQITLFTIFLSPDTYVLHISSHALVIKHPLNFFSFHNLQ